MNKPNFPKGMAIFVHNNDINSALRKLKKRVMSEGILQDSRKKEFYVSPSEQKRIAKQSAIKRHKKSRNTD